MMPVVEEQPAKTTRRRSVLPAAAAKPVKGIPIRNFYQSPEKKPKTSGTVPARKQLTSRNLQELVPSPKKVSKHSFLTVADIAESLDDMFETTPTDGKKRQKTFETEAPEKVKPRRATIHLKSPMVSVSQDLMKVRKWENPSPVKKIDKSVTPGKATKTPAKVTKTPAKATKTPAKATKTPAKETKTPAKATKTPAKASKTPAKTLITPAKTEMTPALKTLALSSKTPSKPSKTPAKTAKTAKTPAKSSKTPAKPAKTPAKPGKTPGKEAEAKGNLKRKAGGEDEVAPSKRARLSTPTPAASTPAAGPRTGSVKRMVAARHVLVAKRTPALRKVATRTISTPAQLNPANLLKKNMKIKVSTAIDTKIALKPNSSPYLLKSQVNDFFLSIKQFVDFHLLFPIGVYIFCPGNMSLMGKI